MKKTGFKNFRRFEQFDPIELGEITFLVGKNNSGKTTLIKAILLVVDYLKNKQIGLFKFDGHSLNDANVISFKRTLFNEAKSDEISFDIHYKGFDCKIKITGSPNDNAAKVVELNMSESYYGFELHFNLIGNTLVTIKRKLNDHIPENKLFNKAMEELKNLQAIQQKFKGNKSDKEYIQLTNDIGALNKKISSFSKIQSNNTEDYEITYELGQQGIERLSVNEIIDEVLNLNRVQKNDTSIKDTKRVSSIRSLFNDESKLSSLIKQQFDITLNGLNVSYFGADSYKQSALYSLRDKDNSLAQAIHNFYQLKIQRNDEASRFLRNWMFEFDIGISIKIESIESEAYKCLIIIKKSNTKKSNTNIINLSDLGMGSLQVMKLLLRIASVIHKHDKHHNALSEEFIIIEEPELNLHPALQSKLVDLFYFLSKKYGFKFIIETHSEYIIRRSQVIALKNDLLSNQETNPNPFKVYYFHITDGPYEMEYTHEGRFNRNFGDGFFNAATNSTKELFKLNRR